MANCKRCGAEVVWITTARNGKKMPLNDNLGQHREPVFDEDGNYCRDGGYGRTSHWGTCPASKDLPRTGKQDQGQAQRQRSWDLVVQGSTKTWSLEELRGMASNLSRLVGIMRSSGADATQVEKTRDVVQGIIRKGWSQ